MERMADVVFNGSKILIRKQITTCINPACCLCSCFQWFKDTNSKANHNHLLDADILFNVVFNGSKILIRKQITTGSCPIVPHFSCFQWFKDTNSKANHNSWFSVLNRLLLFSMVQRY